MQLTVSTDKFSLHINVQIHLNNYWTSLINMTVHSVKIILTLQTQQWQQNTVQVHVHHHTVQVLHFIHTHSCDVNLQDGILVAKFQKIF